MCGCGMGWWRQGQVESRPRRLHARCQGFNEQAATSRSAGTLCQSWTKMSGFLGAGRNEACWHVVDPEGTKNGGCKWLKGYDVSLSSSLPLSLSLSSSLIVICAKFFQAPSSRANAFPRPSRAGHHQLPIVPQPRTFWPLPAPSSPLPSSACQCIYKSFVISIRCSHRLAVCQSIVTVRFALSWGQKLPGQQGCRPSTGLGLGRDN